MSARTRALLGVSVLLAASCATGRPDFEQRFGPDALSRNRWAQLLVTRYGCDTTFTRPQYGMGYEQVNPSSVRAGTLVCEISSSFPTAVLAWRTPEGLREEWRFSSPARGSWMLLWEGPDPLHLRVTANSER